MKPNHDERSEASVSPQPRLQLGALLDLLGEAAVLLDDGKAAPTEALKCVYREAVHEAMSRLREADRPRFATDDEVRASAARMMEKHRPSLEKLAALSASPQQVAQDEKE